MRCLGLTGNNERSAGSEKTAASLAYGPGHHRAPSQPRSRRRKRPTDRGGAMRRKFSHRKGGTSRTADRELSGRPIAIELGPAWGAIKTALAAPRRPLAHPQAA